MGRRVFISILGTGFYEKCKYTSNDFCSEEVRFVQEAILQNIGVKSWSNEDTGVILLTENARADNWNKSITLRKKFRAESEFEYESLEWRIERMNLPIEIQTIPIPDGKNETEIWQIFKILFDFINDEDELYFDLTHSFRYLPMLLLVFGNYVKFLKNAKIAHISYGNYEARDVKKNIAPIINLLPISALQDWTFASANYLENGNVSRLVDLCNAELKPILIETKGKDENTKNLQRFISSLKKVVEERTNCRGISIVNADNMKILKQSAANLPSTFIEPLNPIFERIKKSLDDFDENENVQNGFAAVKWCLDFGLYQQATTILNENIVTYICLKNGLNWKLEAERLLVNTAFKVYNSQVHSKAIDAQYWKVTNDINIEYVEKIRLIEIVKNLITTCEVQKLSDLFVSLSDLRNDFNHSGIRNNAMSTDKLKASIIEKFALIQNIILTC